MSAKKHRIDVLLVQRGFAPSRQRAQAMILAGQVRVDGQNARKAGESVAVDSRIEIIGGDAKFASRAGAKLEGALADFGVDVRDKICLDVGSSNGGFTDCLLQHGARRVHAVDVNIAQLDWKLQRDERVRAIKKNARFLKAEDIGETATIVTVDVSFISVTKLLPAVAAIGEPGADFLILIKPQFELEKRLVGKGGVVRDTQLHERAIASVRAAAAQCGLAILGLQPSRITGAAGNQEYFLHARRRDSIQFFATREP